MKKWMGMILAGWWTPVVQIKSLLNKIQIKPISSITRERWNGNN